MDLNQIMQQYSDPIRWDAQGNRIGGTDYNAIANFRGGGIRPDGSAWGTGLAGGQVNLGTVNMMNDPNRPQWTDPNATASFGPSAPTGSSGGLAAPMAAPMQTKPYQQPTQDYSQMSWEELQALARQHNQPQQQNFGSSYGGGTPSLMQTTQQTNSGSDWGNLNGWNSNAWGNSGWGG
jgi:hypothetical protein